ncbi:MAG: HYR domain-containing protein [Nocardioides sp.]
MRTVRRSLAHRVATVAAATAAGVMALPTSAIADTVYNNLDNTVDATAETMSVTAGGATGTTSLFVAPANGDGVNGCNVKNTNALTVTVASSNASVATVSPSSVTFETCGDGQQITVTPKAAGSANVTVSVSSNNTGGTFDVAPATFTVNVAKPANTAPTVSVKGVTSGSAYEYGNVPVAQCEAVDKEDGTSTFRAALSAITGPRASDGLGSQTAACAYTDKGDSAGQNKLSATASVTYSIVDTTKPLVTATAPGASEATGALTAVTFASSANDAVDGALPVSCTAAGGKSFASGDGFPVGTTTLTYSATDKAGNTGSADPINVVVRDTTKPTLTTSGNLVVGNDSSTGATVTYDAPSASDLVDGAVEASCTPASGTQFALGTTTVTCTATDKANNKATETFTITVQDKTKPTVQVPADIFAEATGPNGATVDYGTVSATDDVDGGLEVSCDKAAGTFPLGTTTVTCSAADKAGNSSENTFTVTVQDKTAPRLTVPDHVSAEATSGAGAVVEFATSAMDIVDGAVQTSCVPETGSTFALGETDVLCTAKDEAGNADSASFTVSVVDTTAPVVVVPKDVTVEATGSDGAVVAYGDVSASDIVDGSMNPTCSKASGQKFGLGTTNVTCTAKDAAGNEGKASFNVKVVDTTAPVVSTPANLQVGNDAGAAGAKSVSYGPATATDIVDGNVAVTCDPASGSPFKLGVTEVTCIATDKAGNPGSATFTVEVQDQNKPIVHVPSAVQVSATGPGGATYSWSDDAVSAEDDVDGTLPATCDKKSGATFPLGETTVTCSAVDKAGNKADNTFTIAVVDDKAPVVTVPNNITMTATSAKGTVVNFSGVSATDVVDGSVPTNCTPASGSLFPMGTTTVTCTAKDKAGNSDTKDFKVTVTAAWSGVLQPVNADGSSVFKLGSTVPVKFQLTGASAGVKDLVARLYYARISSAGTGLFMEADSTSNATTGNLFRYDATANQYIFNLGTKTLSTGTYKLRIDLGDGLERTVNISLK